MLSCSSIPVLPQDRSPSGRTSRAATIAGLVAYLCILCTPSLLAAQGPHRHQAPPGRIGTAVEVAETRLGNATLQRAMSRRLIVNAHEHIQSSREVAKLKSVMDELGISKTLLMGSARFTITLRPKDGFTRYDENNAAIVGIAAAEPGRFEAWPTIDPRDPENLDKARRLMAQGAKGIKLYLGHGYIDERTNEYLFHSMAMDDPRMLSFYAWCQANFVPVMYHVNPFKPGFAEEFIAVLTGFPDLKIIAPHFILSSIKDSRLQEFLDTFPNLYSDISFGHDNFLIPGLKRISRKPGKFKRLFEKYPDRFMFGTDLVVTEHPRKTPAWMSVRFRAYLSMLATSSYEVDFLPDRQLRGLGLSGAILEGILYRNYETFMALRPRGTQITRQIDWTKMGVARTGRKKGTTTPPPPANSQ
ncbi:MAG: amidohydrolase family protein [Myxococcota bacterium]|nr:amidohydrolase family protein [Myxococcota bacterium]